MSIYEKPVAELIMLNPSEEMMLEYDESVGDWDEVVDW